MATRIQVRRGTTSEWNTANPILTEGEFGYNTTLDKFKIGDGTSTWSVLEYVPTSADLSSSLGDYIALTEKGGADGVAELDATYNVLTKTAVVFEGATADAYETTLLVTDPTADRTLTLPNATGTVALTSDLSSYATLAAPAFTGTTTAVNLTLSGDLTVNGTTTTVNSTTINVSNAFVFEGTTADAFETTLTVTDPTADRTITLPDAAGTVQLRVADVDDTEIGYLNGVTSAIQTQLDGKVDESLFDAKGDILVASADNTPAKLGVGTNGYILTANSGATNGVEWAAAPISLPSQTGNSGKYLTTDGSTASWGTVSSYSAPTLGSTSIASGATVSNIAGLTINSTTIPSSATLLTSGGALGTPSSGTLTNATGLPISGLTSSTSAALGLGTIELGHATDTTIARGSAGVVTIEGVNIVTTSSTDTLTNKTLSSAIATTALTLNATAELRLADTDSTHYVGFKSPSTVTTNKIWTLPSADGTSGQVLSTNGSATLSWSTPAAGAAFSEFMLIGA